MNDAENSCWYVWYTKDVIGQPVPSADDGDGGNDDEDGNSEGGRAAGDHTESVSGGEPSGPIPLYRGANHPQDAFATPEGNGPIASNEDGNGEDAPVSGPYDSDGDDALVTDVVS